LPNWLPTPHAGGKFKDAGEKTLGFEEITRRKFIENVAKYCGAGIAAFGLA
jgi:hypothetical protein